MQEARGIVELKTVEHKIDDCGDLWAQYLQFHILISIPFFKSPTNNKNKYYHLRVKTEENAADKKLGTLPPPSHLH